MKLFFHNIGMVKKNRHSKLILIQENVINNLEINYPVNPLEQCKRILKNSNNRPK